MTQAEKERYTNLFRQMVGETALKIDGPKVRDFLLQSGLSPQTLSQIWFVSPPSFFFFSFSWSPHPPLHFSPPGFLSHRTLCDKSGDGQLNEQEFAIAMHLVYAKLAGQEVPQSLPPGLLTPSPTSSLDSDPGVDFGKPVLKPNASAPVFTTLPPRDIPATQAMRKTQQRSMSVDAFQLRQLSQGATSDGTLPTPPSPTTQTSFSQTTQSPTPPALSSSPSTSFILSPPPSAPQQRRLHSSFSAASLDLGGSPQKALGTSSPSVASTAAMSASPSYFTSTPLTPTTAAPASASAAPPTPSPSKLGSPQIERKRLGSFSSPLSPATAAPPAVPLISSRGSSGSSLVNEVVNEPQSTTTKLQAEVAELKKEQHRLAQELTQEKQLRGQLQQDVEALRRLLESLLPGLASTGASAPSQPPPSSSQ